jgi:hypothetical protein
MKTKVMALAMRVSAAALAVAVLFGYRCPAQGCPACKIVGK